MSWRHFYSAVGSDEKEKKRKTVKPFLLHGQMVHILARKLPIER
jgi:hypothetical protein